MSEKTLARFAAHREAWKHNEALRILYTRWYGRIRELLPPLRPWVELGSGPGLARELIPELELTDLVAAPWHDRRVDAQALPFADGELGALVLFDVLHHLPAPARLFSEAERVLRPGGRIVLCEPYVSAASYPVYKFLHEEGLDLGADPLAEELAERDPFDANQAIPTLLFRRHARVLAARFKRLRVVSDERLAGLAYPASGGFGRGPLLPLALWRALLALEDLIPASAFRLFGFRLLVALERVDA
jgi:SAM-dependent methyltransferase